jgi:hypothetical protein
MHDRRVCAALGSLRQGMLAAMAALIMLAADTAAQELRRAQTREEVAPRQGGEPIMAIVSIKSQQVTFYDADGWILRAPVSTGRPSTRPSRRLRDRSEEKGPPFEHV